MTGNYRNWSGISYAVWFKYGISRDSGCVATKFRESRCNYWLACRPCLIDGLLPVGSGNAASDVPIEKCCSGRGSSVSERVQLCALWHPEHQIRESSIGYQLPIRHQAAKPGLVRLITFLHEPEFTAPAVQRPAWLNSEALLGLLSSCPEAKGAECFGVTHQNPRPLRCRRRVLTQQFAPKSP